MSEGPGAYLQRATMETTRARVATTSCATLTQKAALVMVRRFLLPVARGIRKSRNVKSLANLKTTLLRIGLGVTRHPRKGAVEQL